MTLFDHFIMFVNKNSGKVLLCPLTRNNTVDIRITKLFYCRIKPASSLQQNKQYYYNVITGDILEQSFSTR